MSKNPRGYPKKKERGQYLKEIFRLRERLREYDAKNEKLREELEELQRMKIGKAFHLVKEWSVELKQKLLEGKIEEVISELDEIIEGEPQYE